VAAASGALKKKEHCLMVFSVSACCPNIVSFLDVWQESAGATEGGESWDVIMKPQAYLTYKLEVVILCEFIIVCFYGREYVVLFPCACTEDYEVALIPMHR
jgi:hypothetical protein